MLRWIEQALDALLAIFWSVFLLATLAGIWREKPVSQADNAKFDPFEDDDPVFLMEG